MNTYTTWTQTSTAYAAYQAASAKCAAAFATPKAELNAWTHPRTGETRYYVNNLPELIGLDIDRYKSGNIAAASLAGSMISNSQAYKILNDTAKTYITRVDGQVKIWLNTHFSNRVINRDEVLSAIRSAI